MLWQTHMTKVLVKTRKATRIGLVWGPWNDIYRGEEQRGGPMYTFRYMTTWSDAVYSGTSLLRTL